MPVYSQLSIRCRGWYTAPIHHQSVIMPDRAGYQVSVYAIDVSTSMGEVIDDPTGNSSSINQKTKLDYVKEFVARKCEPKVCAGHISPYHCG